MVNTKITFKDADGFHYKHPERSCERCLNFPCVNGQDKLKSNFAAYGCQNYSDSNKFDL